jgi:hypothetical protein
MATTILKQQGFLLSEISQSSSYICIDDVSVRFPANYVDPNYGKNFRKCRIKFVEAYASLMKTQRFQKPIHTAIKHLIEAQRLCTFYQQLADKEEQDLYCYVDYVSLTDPIDVKRYTVYICNMAYVSKVRTDIMYNMIKQKLDNKDSIVLMESCNREFLIKVAKLALKDFLQPFQLCIQERYFTAQGPNCTFNVLYIDTTRELPQNHRSDNDLY